VKLMVLTLFGQYDCLAIFCLVLHEVMSGRRSRLAMQNARKKNLLKGLTRLARRAQRILTWPKRKLPDPCVETKENRLLQTSGGGKKGGGGQKGGPQNQKKVPTSLLGS